jgi:hypothetical protein
MTKLNTSNATTQHTKLPRAHANSSVYSFYNQVRLLWSQHDTTHPEINSEKEEDSESDVSLLLFRVMIANLSMLMKSMNIKFEKQEYWIEE